MQIEGIPEGVYVEAIRPAQVGDVYFSGLVDISTPEMVMVKVGGDYPNVVPHIILQANPGYEFQELYERHVGYVKVAVVKVFDAPKTVAVEVKDESQLERVREFLRWSGLTAASGL